MKSYLLLRNNQKMGPYNLEEIIGNELKPFDLIWKEGESEKWQYPGEIEELINYVKPQPGFIVGHYPTKVFQQPTIINGICISMPPKFTSPTSTFHFKRQQYAHVEIPELTTRFSEPLENLRLKYQQYNDNKNRSLKRITFFTNVSYLLLILAVILAGSFLMNKIIKNFAESKLANNAYKAQSAKILSLPEAIVEEIADPAFQNALITEIIPASEISHQTNNELKNRAVSKVPLVGVSFNHFKVLKKGGIQNLEIIIFNNASSTVDEITIEIDFINKSGKTLFTKEYYSSKLKPNSFKIIPIPPSKIGTNIICRVKKMSSKGFETTLQKT